MPEFGYNRMDQFRGLSISFGCPILYRDHLFGSAMQLFNFFKCRKTGYRTLILNARDEKDAGFIGSAFGMGFWATKHRKPYALRDDWEATCDKWMQLTLDLKFGQNSVLAEILKTSKGTLVEIDNSEYWRHPEHTGKMARMLTKLRKTL